MGKSSKVLGAGLGLALAATAGAYLLYKRNQRVRRKTNVWAENMKRDIKEKLASFDEINKSVFHDTIEQIGRRYGRMKEVNKEELSGLLDDLKEAWDHFKRDLSSVK